MYQLLKANYEGQKSFHIKRLSDNAYIPMSTDNTDYQQFLKDIKEGVELLDADGNVVTDFVKELP